MPDPIISVEINGLKETNAQMERIARDLGGERFLDAMRDATIWVQTDAKRYVPVDTGRLRASITPEVRAEGQTVWGVVGSNVHYAPYLETGTRPHWPPMAALETWAARHGTTALAVARSIAKHGTSVYAQRTLGTKGFRYLQRALDTNADRIRAHLGDVVGEIVNR